MSNSGWGDNSDPEYGLDLLFRLYAFLYKLGVIEDNYLKETNYSTFEQDREFATRFTYER